ncbi:GNAT family N-acetyltransferase [Sphingomonas sp. TDK1]|uniref:GNAT family N-acetyltransferase n=1 Tax=Sphingomonas sp. TDK1 TaxID=453247 RepID=UPI0007D978ED|nr:GNAT family N-acetyltransferase [Sphingomonas sp. TDK1]OAN60223.1 hypothetical protein A7X12_01660 [Sphingomonas sp. TDK1]
MDLGTVPPALVHAWLAGRSISRGVPPPVPDRGGFRVDSRSDTEYCRWVFAAPSASVTELARDIQAPGRLIKLCDTQEALRALLPLRWELHPPAFFMRGGDWPAAPPLANGYRCRTATHGAVTCVTIVDPAGATAASGFAAETGGAFVYDRIVTAADHRRKGLGSVVMAALHAARRGRDTPELLVATDAGRALYSRLGWHVLSPYATASLPMLSPAG